MKNKKYVHQIIKHIKIDVKQNVEDCVLKVLVHVINFINE